MANIKQIAEKAGVSVTTVSRVLNNHPYVSSEKKEAVLTAVEQLHYTRNINAIHLAKGKTHLIGVVIPYTNHPYFGAIMEGISKRANAFGYHLVIFQTHYEKDKELQALEMLKMKQLDALIICSRINEVKTLNEYNRYGPIILCEDSAQDTFPSISIDQYTAFSTALTYLIERGHRKIGYSLGRKKGRNSHLRSKAYQDIIREFKLETNPDWIFEGCYNMKDGVDIFNKWLHFADKPDALIITNDQAAAGCMLAGKNAGIDFPEQLAVIGFDNDEIAKQMGITTVSLPLESMGKTAVDLFIDGNEPQQIKLDFQLIQRSSC
ncbi:LacI family DNA-binding transcriptional regulator [Bacillus sp. V59.32b]|uniref:LacI family DNA-binding transcriptional regulator n=1 Tax=Bacillus sp. V59.32b TaxID=1758642 RepID=UPI000E3CD22E|nr:LacI family DNA-binding transcriptional regulator [Bacillus sp. V59.32b]RFU67364.1 LacI family DNA-binding transcriptional regulator [Bacillus sp. V59.32b]